MNIEAHQAGRTAARNGVSRHDVNETAIHCLTVNEGDAYLAGYYAETRRMNAERQADQAKRAADRRRFDQCD